MESTFAVLSFAENTLGLSAVHALVDRNNIASVKVFDNTGFQFIELAALTSVFIVSTCSR
ncbi:GNAT family N-acetyltransferase [Shewanella sp. KX20019]|uniref:GNAT family N-acetyltransferase n=1 Tax=Shewanella sp. KX20019 TaxID=2803864 RepID=UPI003FA79D00